MVSSRYVQFSASPSNHLVSGAQVPFVRQDFLIIFLGRLLNHSSVSPISNYPSLADFISLLTRRSFKFHCYTFFSNSHRLDKLFHDYFFQNHRRFHFLLLLAWPRLWNIRKDWSCYHYRHQDRLVDATNLFFFFFIRCSLFLDNFRSLRFVSRPLLSSRAVFPYFLILNFPF